MNAQLIVKAGTLGMTKMVGTGVLHIGVEALLKKVKPLKDTLNLGQIVYGWEDMDRSEKIKEVAKWLGVSLTAAFISAAVMGAIVDALDEQWDLATNEDDVFVEDFDATIEEVEAL